MIKFMGNESFSFGESVCLMRAQESLYGAGLSMFLVQKGETSLVRGNQEYRVKEGHVGLMTFSDELKHSSSLGRVSQIKWCQSNDSAFLDSVFSDLPISVPTSEALLGLIDIGLNGPKGNSRYQQKLRNTIGQAVFYEYGLRTKLAELEATDFPRAVQLAKQYIDAHYTETCSAKIVGDALGYTRQHISRAFKANIGLSPDKYIWRLRREKAVDLLRHTELSVTEIAYRCGYKTPYHFSNQIKEHLGCSPKTLRC